MDTYYSRHTMAIGIDDLTRDRLWHHHIVAIHVPDDISGTIMNGPDNVSLNPADHTPAGRRRLKALLNLARDGGYVYAEYHLSDTDVRHAVGKVHPGSKIEILRGTWGGRYNQGDRPAALLFVRTFGVLLNPPHFKGAPRRSTLCRWPSIGSGVSELYGE
jgi:hypothetical protein